MPDPDLDELFGELRESALPQIEPPGQDAVRRTVRRRRMRQRLVAAVVVALMAGGIAGVLSYFRTAENTVISTATPSPSLSPSPSPSPTPSPSVSASRSTVVDWPNATYDLPALSPCPARGGVKFSAGEASRGSTSWKLNGGTGFIGPYVADINGDGVKDALLRLDCTSGSGGGSSFNVVAAIVHGDGTTSVYKVAGTTSYNGETIKSARLSGGYVVVQITNPLANNTRTLRYRWNGDGFSATASSSIRDVNWANVTLSLGKMSVCPAKRVTFTDYQAGDLKSAAWQLDAQIAFGDLNSDGRDDALVAVYCQQQRPNETFSQPDVLAYGLTDDGRLTLLSGVYSFGAGGINNLSVSGGVAVVNFNSTTFRFKWNGSRFVQQ
ncbi:hypothetical protein [Fodinicola acaciae]|uniref:hypothetical protein n=1 Tax=Fodinicola acaciae TaxID=2681555 RepID=UPI0013D74ADA|nr:hypothetical protein [Fodinicola acaciae]